MFQYPLLPLSLRILCDGIEQYCPNTKLHLLLELSHPVLNILVLRVDVAVEWDAFLFSRQHCCYVLLLTELDFVNVFKDLLQVGLNS